MQIFVITTFLYTVVDAEKEEKNGLRQGAGIIQWTLKKWASGALYLYNINYIVLKIKTVLTRKI